MITRWNQWTIKSQPTPVGMIYQLTQRSPRGEAIRMESDELNEVLSTFIVIMKRQAKRAMHHNQHFKINMCNTETQQNENI